MWSPGSSAIPGTPNSMVCVTGVSFMGSRLFQGRTGFRVYRSGCDVSSRLDFLFYRKFVVPEVCCPECAGNGDRIAPPTCPGAFPGVGGRPSGPTLQPAG